MIKLVEEFLENTEYLNNDQKKAIIELIQTQDNPELVKELYEVYKNFYKKEKYRGKNFEIKFEKNLCYIIFKGQEAVLEQIDAKNFLVTMIDLLEEVLPLGSVVTLKKEYMGNIIPENFEKELKIVIINRFMFRKGTKAYFPYIGILYPFGFLEKEQSIQFSANLIDKVLKKSYSDQDEKDFVFNVKRELIIQEKMHSFGFASKEEKEEYAKMQTDLQKGR